MRGNRTTLGMMGALLLLGGGVLAQGDEEAKAPDPGEVAPAAGNDAAAPDPAPAAGDDDSAAAAGDDDSAVDNSDWTQQAADVGVELVSPVDNARSGDLIGFKVINKRGEPIFAFGCRPLQPEMFGEERWETLPGDPCATEGIAQRIDPGESEIKLAAKGRRRMLFRATLSYGVGCTENVPLSAAECRAFATAASRKIRVTPGGDE